MENISPLTLSLRSFYGRHHSAVLWQVLLMRLVIFSSAQKHRTRCSAYSNNFRIDICHPIIDVVCKLWFSDILNPQSDPEHISLSRYLLADGLNICSLCTEGDPPLGSASQLSEMKRALPLHKHRRKIQWHQISIDMYSLWQNCTNSPICIKNTKIMFCFRKIFKSVPHPTGHPKQNWGCHLLPLTKIFYLPLENK